MNGPLDDIYRFQLTMTESGKEALKVALREFIVEKFKEKVVVIDCPYAEAVEFGTTPSKGPTPEYQIVQDQETGEYISAVRLKFREWIGLKEGLQGKERAKLGDTIYNAVMENGAHPHPYIRPAVQDLMMYDIKDIQEITGINDPADACVYFLAIKMKKYLEQNESVVTGTLKDSIKVVPSKIAGDIKDVDLDESNYNWKPGDKRV